MENIAMSNVTPERGSGVCLTCRKLRRQVFISFFLYMIDVASDIVLGVFYVWDGDLQDGVSTLVFVILPSIAILLVNFVEENLRVQTSSNCFHYLRYLPPISKLFHLRAHELIHAVTEEQRQEAELKCKLEDRNAAILKDVGACFESAPQLVLQLSLIFRDISTFDGDLLRVTSPTNGFKICSIFTSAFSCVSVLYGRLENTNFRSREEYLQERRLALFCIFSRVLFVLGYSSIASVSSLYLVILATLHWIVMLVLLLRRDRHRIVAIVLEALLHVFQYITWSHREDARAAVRALKITTTCEWLLVLTGIGYVVIKRDPVYVVYNVVAITYTCMILLYVLFVCIRRFCCMHRTATTTFINPSQEQHESINNHT